MAEFSRNVAISHPCLKIPKSLISQKKGTLKERERQKETEEMKRDLKRERERETVREKKTEEM